MGGKQSKRLREELVALQAANAAAAATHAQELERLRDEKRLLEYKLHVLQEMTAKAQVDAERATQHAVDAEERMKAMKWELVRSLSVANIPAPSASAPRVPVNWKLKDGVVLRRASTTRLRDHVGDTETTATTAAGSTKLKASPDSAAVVIEPVKVALTEPKAAIPERVKRQSLGPAIGGGDNQTQREETPLTVKAAAAAVTTTAIAKTVAATAATPSPTTITDIAHKMRTKSSGSSGSASDREREREPKSADDKTKKRSLLPGFLRRKGGAADAKGDDDDGRSRGSRRGSSAPGSSKASAASDGDSEAKPSRIRRLDEDGSDSDREEKPQRQQRSQQQQQQQPPPPVSRRKQLAQPAVDEPLELSEAESET